MSRPSPEARLDWPSRLTFVRVTDERNKFGQRLRLHICECGTEVLIPSHSTAKSCGCLKRDRMKELAKLHGSAGQEAAARSRITHAMTGTAFYRVYKSMMNRCYRKGSSSYDRYGGRGIQVSTEWHYFERFHADMYLSYVAHRALHPGARQTQLDRIDNDGDYSKENCRWATPSEQAFNRRPKRWHKKPTDWTGTR